jgi:hypothetical protein
MVYSNINSAIFYKEDDKIDDEDIGYESTLYEMEIYKKKILIVFGKLKYTFIQRNIAYVPIYLVVYNKVVKRIGVLEFTKNDALDLLDDDNDIIIDNIPTPITFGFFNENFVDTSGSDSNQFVKEQHIMKKQEEEEEEEEEEEDVDTIDNEKEIVDEEEDIFSLKVKPSKMSMETKIATQKLEDGIFIIDQKIKLQPDLLEESDEMAKTLREDFDGSPNDNWIQTYMKNINYNTHDVESNGDCFFAVIRDAFKQIGYITTVSKLRAILSKNITEEIFNEYRKLFIDLTGTINEYNRELQEIKEKIEMDLNKRAKKVKNNKFELRSVLNEIKELKDKHKIILKSKQTTQSMISDDIGDIAHIDTIEKFREYIQTSGFWADSWAINTLEELLNVKFIILSERSYIENDLHNVLLCGEISEKIASKKIFTPNHYIITTFSGNHYKLVEYKNKRIFKFFEIPYHIKTIILNKCLERNSGAFSIIPDFNDMKTKIGIVDEEEDEEEVSPSLYDNKIIFEFYRNSNNSAKPGKGTNEKIPNDKRSNFIELSKISNWRRKLHDTWSDASFTIDDKKWLSVEHYYQASKFKKQNPDFTALFSLDNVGSEIAKDVDLAISAGSKTGKVNVKAKKKLKGDNVILRPTNIDIDPDFYGERSMIEREIAISAKFEQNEDLKLLLFNTKNAKLVHYIHGAPGEKDILLMNLRHKLLNLESYTSR